MEAARQILSGGEIDRRLPPNGGIHHGQQRGGDLYIVHAPLVGRSGKAGQITGHAPAQGQEKVSPADTVFGKIVQ